MRKSRSRNSRQNRAPRECARIGQSRNRNPIRADGRPVVQHEKISQIRPTRLPEERKNGCCRNACCLAETDNLCQREWTNIPDLTPDIFPYVAIGRRKRRRRIDLSLHSLRHQYVLGRWMLRRCSLPEGAQPNIELPLLRIDRFYRLATFLSDRQLPGDTQDILAITALL